MTARNDIQPTDRLPAWFPGRPDIYIDALREPSPAAFGAEDRSPTNLAGYSDYALDQPSSGNRPTWKANRWESDVNDWWIENDNIPSNPYSWTIWFAGEIDFSETNESQIVLAGHFTADARVYLRADASNDFVSASIWNDSTNVEARTFLSNIKPSDGPFVVATEMVFGPTVSLYARGFSANGNTDYGSNSSARDDSISLTRFQVGDDGGGAPATIDGSIYSAGCEFESDWSGSGIDRATAAIARDYGLQPRPKVSVRVPESYPANPDLDLDTTREPTSPPDGGGVQRPTNLATPVGFEAEQGNETNQPIWKQNVEGLPYYSFEGDDYLSVPAPETRRVMAAFVLEPTKDGTSYGYGAGNSSGNERIAFVTIEATDDLRVDARDAGGTFHRANVPLEFERQAVVCWWDLVENVIEIHKSLGDGVETARTDFSGSASFDQFTGASIGANNGINPITAPFYKAQLFYDTPTIGRSSRDLFCLYLANKYL